MLLERVKADDLRHEIFTAFEALLEDASKGWRRDHSVRFQNMNLVRRMKKCKFDLA